MIYEVELVLRGDESGTILRVLRGVCTTVLALEWEVERRGDETVSRVARDMNGVYNLREYVHVKRCMVCRNKNLARKRARSQSFRGLVYNPSLQQV